MTGWYTTEIHAEAALKVHKTKSLHGRERSRVLAAKRKLKKDK